MISAAKAPTVPVASVAELPPKNIAEVRRSAFTWGNLLKNVILIAFLVGVNKAGKPGNAIFYTVICVMAMTSSQNAIKALSVGVLALVSNTAFVEKSIVFSVGRFALIFICFARVFYDTRGFAGLKIYRSAAISLAVFVVVAGILSVVNNYYIGVSLLKLANFALGLYIILAGVEMLKKTSGEITCWMVSIAGFVVIMGLASIAAGVGYNGKEVNGMPSLFFNGPFYHSNTLGPLGAMMVVYLLAVACFTPYRLKWITWPMIGALFMFVLMTKSRTAAASCLMGAFALSLAAFIFSKRKGLRVRLNIKTPTLFIAGLVALVVCVFAIATRGNAIFESIQTFVAKNQNATGFYADEILASRQGQIDMTMYNFKRAPMTGIGFGTATTAEFQETATWYSAPTEKGNLLLALLEETGVPGAIAFFVFLVVFGLTVWKTLNAPAIGVFTTFFMVNMGEMMFFSFGGHGAYAWVFVGAALALGDRCLVFSPNANDCSRN
jgi:hypothetical protein